ncbi:MAG: ABC transporter ATP-binding protein [Bacteroidales bacterium]|nr:ABC transporter ATP-binding protein [Bacteroidales bacterium]
MKQYLKPANFIYLILVALLFFILGALISSLLGVAKDQGLAAGAIVVGYGVITGIVALFLALISLRFIPSRMIVKINYFFTLALMVFIALLFLKISKGNPAGKGLSYVSTDNSTGVMQLIEPSTRIPIEENSGMGLGMFFPAFLDNPVLYFYGIPNLLKTPDDHTPTDSLVFTRTELGYEISYAPPWFVPAILKMDYDVMYLRVLAVHENFLEVTVNESNDQTDWINRWQGTLYYWPDFLLRVNSVEQTDCETNPVRVRPLSYAGLVMARFSYLKPVQVKQNWLQVELLDEKLNSNGFGWIQWNKMGKLTIRYSLFS